MPFDAGAAISRLDLDISGYRTGFMQAQGIASVFPSIISNFVANPLLGLADIAKQAFGAVKQAFDDSVGRADAMNDLAAQVGVTTEELTGFGFAAEQAGGSTAGLGQGLRFLNDNIADAVRGNKDMVAEFEGAGVAFADMAGNARKPTDVMLDLADAIKNTDDASKRQKISEVMGKMGTQLIPMLREGAAGMLHWKEVSDQVGGTVSTKFAGMADKFGDLRGVMTKAWQGIESAVGEPILEAVTPMLEKIVNFTTQNMPQIRAQVGEVIKFIIGMLEQLGDKLKGVWDVLQNTVGKAADWAAQKLYGDRADANAVGLTARSQAYKDDKANQAKSTVVNVGVINDKWTEAQVQQAVKKGREAARSEVRKQIDTMQVGSDVSEDYGG